MRNSGTIFERIGATIRFHVAMFASSAGAERTSFVGRMLPDADAPNAISPPML